MALQTVTLKVSDELYRRLQRRAEQAHRSVEDEVLELVASALPLHDGAQASLDSALASLDVLVDAALWNAARMRMPADAAAELEDLHLKRQRERLAASEMERAAQLLRFYERTMLIRAQAAMLLKQRRHDISDLALPA